MIKTGHRPHRDNSRVKQMADRLDSLVTEKPLMLLFLLSLAAAVQNIYLAALPLVVLQLAEKTGTKYLCAVIAVLFFAPTVFRTAFYIPCIVFVMLYIISDYLLDTERQRKAIPAVAAFVISKSYVLTFGFDGHYWLVLAVEAFMLVTAADSVEAGFDILHYNDRELNPQAVFETVSALCTVALALTAVQFWAVSLSAAALLSAAFFYRGKNNMTISLVAFAVMVIFLCTDKNFPLLAAGFGGIYLGGMVLLTGAVWGYIAVIAVAVAVAAVTISQFNSLVFISTTAVALLTCFVWNKLGVVKQKSVSAQTVGQSQADAVTEKVDRLNRCFRFLGHTVTDISDLMGTGYIPAPVEDTVAQEICRSCKKSAYCWQERYSDTQTQFSRCAKAVSAGTAPVFEGWFLGQCDKTERLVQAFYSANRLATTQRLVHSASQHSQRLLQGQFLAMADILRDITRDSVRCGSANTAFTHSADNFLALCGRKVDYCICYQNPDRCVVSMRDYMTEDEIIRFRAKLESIYGCRFADPTKRLCEGSMVYTFCRVPVFRADFSIKTAGRSGQCGDVCESFTADGYTYIVLADGMGTGSFAAAESRTAAAMAQSLLTASVKGETAVEIINIALNLKGTGQSCVALDILGINLYDGSCQLFKAGGAPTVAASGGRVQKIYRDSLPVGILRETNIAQFTFTLNNGDCLVMTSDGIDTDDRMLTAKLKLMTESCTAQQICDCVMASAGRDDDATAAVIKLERA